MPAVALLIARYALRPGEPRGSDRRPARGSPHGAERVQLRRPVRDRRRPGAGRRAPHHARLAARPAPAVRRARVSRLDGSAAAALPSLRPCDPPGSCGRARLREADMAPTSFAVSGRDGTSVATYRWEPAGPARGAVHIVHGLGEHVRRYEHLANTLAGAGFVVQGHDTRGHGDTVADGAQPGVIGAAGLDGVDRRHRRAPRPAPRRRSRRPCRASRAQHGLVRRPAVPGRPQRQASTPSCSAAPPRPT